MQPSTEPLNRWACDHCGDQITDPNLGLVVWRDEDRVAHDFRVVHKSVHGRHCDPGAESGFTSSTEISNFLGDLGQAKLLSFLSVGPVIALQDGYRRTRVADLDQFVDLFRRFQTPWYEEARSQWDAEHTQHWLADASETYPYTPAVLQRVATGTLGH